MRLDERVPLPDGIKITDSLKITEVLGRGGSGITYLAKKKENGAAVVIKEFYPLCFSEKLRRNGVILEAVCPDDEQNLRQYIKNEADEECETTKKVSNISSEVNNSIFHFANEDITDSIISYAPSFEGTLARYLVSETNLGMTIEELANKYELSLQEKLRLLKKALKPVLRLHDLGILHLDIKPQNIFVISELGKDAFCKLLDCGGAKEVENRDNWNFLTISDYAAPEQQVLQRLSPGEDAKKYLEDISYFTDTYSLMAMGLHLVINCTEEEWRGFNCSRSATKRYEFIKAHIEAVTKEKYGYLTELLIDFFSRGLYYHPTLSWKEKRFSCREVEKKIEILLEIMEGKGYHPEVIKRNSKMLYDERYGNYKINVEWLAEVEEL